MAGLLQLDAGALVHLRPAPGLAAGEGRPARTQVTFVVSPRHLVSIRYGDPLPFRTFEAKWARQPEARPTSDLVLVALFAAITAAMGLMPPVSVGFLPVPITLQTLGVMLAGLMLGPVRGGLAMASLGASGAISGVLGAYFRRYPWNLITFWLFPLPFFIPVPALLALGFWFLGQWSALAQAEPGVAWLAHIGGFLAGVLLIGAFVPQSRRRRR